MSEMNTLNRLHFLNGSILLNYLGKAGKIYFSA